MRCPSGPFVIDNMDHICRSTVGLEPIQIGVQAHVAPSGTLSAASDFASPRQPFAGGHFISEATLLHSEKLFYLFGILGSVAQVMRRTLLSG